MNIDLLPPIVGESFRIHSDELIKILISLSRKKFKEVCVRENAGSSWLELEEKISYLIVQYDTYWHRTALK